MQITALPGKAPFALKAEKTRPIMYPGAFFDYSGLQRPSFLPVVINVLYVVVVIEIFEKEIHFLYVLLVGESYI